MEAYLVVREVQGVFPGVYHYFPKEHQLFQLSSQPDFSALKAALLDLPLEKAAALLVLALVPERGAALFGPRGYRYALLEAGYAAGLLLLAATGLGVAAYPTETFYDEEVGRILLVEDDPQVGQLVKAYLEREGYEVLWARTGREALDGFEAPLDLVILDRGLPDLEGLQVLESLREMDPLLPALVLTGRSDEDSRVEGLLSGADDYLGKPFSLKELSARVRALLRRAGKEGSRRFGPLELDFSRLEARLYGEPLRLSPTERALLFTLASAPGRVFSREELLERVWGLEFEGNERVVDAYIRLLRKKLRDDSRRPRYIETVVGLGYRFTGS